MADWAAFKGYNNGKAVVLSAVDKANLLTFGVHYYTTKQQAEAHPNSVASLPNPAALAMIPLVNAAIDDYNNARDISPTVARNPTNPVAAGQAGVNSASNAAGLGGAASWEQSLTSFLGALTNGNTWIRVAEAVLGIVLISVGLSRITHAPEAVRSIARAAGTVAVL